MERLEASAKIEQALANKPTKDDAKKPSKKRKKDEPSQAAMVCNLCGKGGHKANECWSNPKNKSKRPKWYKSKDELKATSKQSNETFSADQFNYLVHNLPSMAKAKGLGKQDKKKRKVKQDEI